MLETASERDMLALTLGQMLNVIKLRIFTAQENTHLFNRRVGIFF